MKDEEFKKLFDGRSVLLAGQEPEVIQEVWQNLPTGLLGDRPALYVVEPSEYRFLDMRGHPVIDNMLRDRNAYFISGHDWAERLFKFLTTENGIQMPHHILAPNDMDIQTVLQRGEESRNVIAAARAKDNILWYEQNNQRGWFKPLLMAPRFSAVVRYVMEDLLEGFEMNHDPTALLMEEHDCERCGSFDFTDAIAKVHPTHIFAINWIRPPGITIPPQVKWWTWVQDVGSQAFTTKNIGPNDRVFAYCPAFKRRLEANGWKDVRVMPPGVSIKTYGPGATERRFLCDVGIFTDVLHPNDATDDKLKAFFRQRVLQRAVPASKLMRAKFNVKMYGRGWEHWIKFTSRYMGVCAPGPLLAQAMRGCKIILRQNKDTNVHTHLWSAIMCGAFPVVQSLPDVDYEPEGLDDLLGGNARKWIGFYAGRKDLIPTLRGFLSHDEGRVRALEDAQKYIRKHHNYAVRAEWLRRVAQNEDVYK